MRSDSYSPEIAICVAVYRPHPAPNLASLAGELPAALGGLRSELVVALNGIDPVAAGVPPGTRTVRFPVNRGVPVAWNAAVRASRAPIICVINDDVSLGPDALRLLHDALLGEPKAGVVGPVGTRWDIASARHQAYIDTSNAPRGQLMACEVLSGFFLVTRRNLFEDVRGFDEDYSPCGFEEVDYCTAVRLRAGMGCYAVAGVDFRHEFGISGARPWHRIAYDARRETLRSISRRNRRHFLAKWSNHVAVSVGDVGRPGERPIRPPA